MTSFNFTESKQKIDEHVKKECSNQNVEKGKQELQMKKKNIYIQFTNWNINFPHVVANHNVVMFHPFGLGTCIWCV